MATADGAAAADGCAMGAAAGPAAWEEEREARIEALLSQMTLQEKIMQIGQIDKTYLKSLDDIAELAFGSIISGGSSQPFENSPAGFADMVDEYQSYALMSRLKIPLLYAGDAVHGMSLCKGTTLFPHNIGLGATNPELIEAIARATAAETAPCGVAWAFAPCVAVAGDCRWGRTYESFAQDTAIVTASGVAHVKGLQGAILSAGGKRVPGAVAACAKHFVGDGGTAFGSGLMGDKLLDRGDVRMEDEEEFRARHLQPYVEAVNAGVLTIMVSFSSWNGEQMHSHKRLIQDVLRGELGFKGLIVSDWAGHEQLQGATTDRGKLALCVNAGVDIIMIPERYRDYLREMQAALAEGLISEARLDEACARVLRLKFDLGLFESPTVDRSLLANVRCPEHLGLARRAVQRSCVLLKNRGPILPLLRPLRSLFVCGKGADDLGLQLGGWSCCWQGTSGAITTGTTILEALTAALPDTDITYAADAEGLEPDTHEAVLVVLAEDPPYAEWFGDRRELSLGATDQQVVDLVVRKGVPVVAVLLSGRPLVEARGWRDVDAVLMAFLPGTEGGLGIVDVLLGVVPPTGTLPVGLPAEMEVDEAMRDFFAVGAGLTYDAIEEGGCAVPAQPFVRREFT